MSHAIHKIVSKNAANPISYRGVRRITAKVKTVICEQAPNHGSYFAYARLIARVISTTISPVWFWHTYSDYDTLNKKKVGQSALMK